MNRDSEYNDENVVWCDKCHSLAITVNWRCKKCGNSDPTQMSIGTIGDYEESYHKRFHEPPLGWPEPSPYDDLGDVYKAQAQEVMTYWEAYKQGLRLTQGKPILI